MKKIIMIIGILILFSACSNSDYEDCFISCTKIKQTSHYIESHCDVRAFPPNIVMKVIENAERVQCTLLNTTSLKLNCHEDCKK